MAGFDLNHKDGRAEVKLSGAFTMEAAEGLKKSLDALPQRLKGVKQVTFDFSKVERLEPNSAYLFREASQKLGEQGVRSTFANLTPGQEALLKSFGDKPFVRP